jgi:CheY-like chemotaxis protein
MMDTLPTATLPAPARPLEGMTVLLVEDETFISDLLKCWFDRLGAHTLTAGNGRDGLRLLAEHAGEVCLVIADFNLPDMDGGDMCTQLRRLKPRLPVLLSSGRYQREAEESLSRTGPTCFIQKPYPLHDVLAKLQKLLTAA